MFLLAETIECFRKEKQLNPVITPSILYVVWCALPPIGLERQMFCSQSVYWNDMINLRLMFKFFCMHLNVVTWTVCFGFIMVLSRVKNIKLSNNCNLEKVKIDVFSTSIVFVSFFFLLRVCSVIN
jgi:hypothetical protein